jgi:hypothetical protein
VYRLELVTSGGHTLWTDIVRTQGSSLTATLGGKTLQPGQYWLRVYHPGNNSALREFGISAE